eukprot:7950533-Ditylum_brightwellii.AAC.1
MIDGNISSYYIFLNKPDKLGLVRETNVLACVLGDIDREIFISREKAKEGKGNEEAGLEKRDKIQAEAAPKKGIWA